MAISWMAALKVVPWGKVMEHAPQVLEKARGLIDKHRPGATVAEANTPAPSAETGEVPSLGELKNRCKCNLSNCAKPNSKWPKPWPIWPNKTPA